MLCGLPVLTSTVHGQPLHERVGRRVGGSPRRDPVDRQHRLRAGRIASARGVRAVGRGDVGAGARLRAAADRVLLHPRVGRDRLLIAAQRRADRRGVVVGRIGARRIAAGDHGRTGRRRAAGRCRPLVGGVRRARSCTRPTGVGPVDGGARACSRGPVVARVGAGRGARRRADRPDHQDRAGRRRVAVASGRPRRRAAARRQRWWCCSAYRSSSCSRCPPSAIRPSSSPRARCVVLLVLQVVVV